MDLYWIHNPADVARWTPLLIPPLQSGRIKHVGVSNHDLKEIALADQILGEAGFRVEAVQNHYSLLYRNSERAGILEHCREHDVRFFSYIIQISSLAGVAAYPTLGAYHACKWALEGLTEALAGEVAQFGIDVTIVEPGAFSTGLGSASVQSEPQREYDSLREALRAGNPAHALGDPAAAARALLKIVDAENPPLRVIFGAHPYEAARQVYAERLKIWAEWGELSVEAQGGQS